MSIEFYSKIFSKFPTSCVFHPNALKSNGWFVIFLTNMKKCCFCNLLTKSLKVFENSLRISQQFAFVVQTRKKYNGWFVKSFEKYAKVMHFPQFSKLFIQNFRKVSPPPPKKSCLPPCEYVNVLVHREHHIEYLRVWIIIQNRNA